VLRNWIHFTEAIRSNDSPKRDIVILNQVTNHSICTTLAQLAVQVDASTRIRETSDFEDIALGVQSLAGDVVKRGLGFWRKNRTAGLEIDCRSSLRCVVVERRDALVGRDDYTPQTTSAVNFKT